MEKLLGRTCKLGGAESMGISKAGETVLARWMEYHIWHQLAASVALLVEGLAKGQWPLLAMMLNTSVSLCITLVPFKLLPRCWSSEGLNLSR